MRFTPTELAGCVIVEPEPVHDRRGFFTRVSGQDEFTRRGLESVASQTSISFNTRRSTLRGLHFQEEPYSEAKLVRCTRGAVFDVAVDVRPDSGTYLRWVSTELTANNRLALYIPRGFAHGFLTLADETELFYQISTPYEASAARGIPWDDPALDIRWPESPRVMSDRDRSWPPIRTTAS